MNSGMNANTLERSVSVTCRLETMTTEASRAPCPQPDRLAEHPEGGLKHFRQRVGSSD
jgi:hypothetical protein